MKISEVSLTVQELSLNPEERQVLQMVYEKFRDRGTWATFGEVDRPLRRLGLTPDAILQTIPRDLLLPFQAGRTQPIARDELQLTLKGISACDGGEEDIDTFLRLIHWLVKKELEFEPVDGTADELLRVKASEIKEFLSLSGDQTTLLSRLRYIINLQRWGWSGGEYESGDWYVQVDRGIHRFAQVKTLDDYMEVMVKWEEEGNKPYVVIPDDFYGSVPGSTYVESVPQPELPEYIAIGVIDDLRAAAAQSVWDCNKLLQLIDELNHNYAVGSTYAAHALLRAILDHIPPLFSCRGFTEVANNYSWGETDKKYMKRLREFRDQADDVLHRQVSKSADVLGIEDMPNRIWLNSLLRECVKLL